MDRRTTLVYYENGTTHSISDEDPLAAFPSSFIILACLLLSAAYNLIVVTAVGCVSKLRECSFRVALAVVCATCLVDSALNQSIALVLLIAPLMGLCPVSAVGFHALLACHTASLGPLCAERAFARYDRPLSPGSCLVAALAAWAFALALSSPLLATPVVHYFPNRNACSAVGGILSILTLIVLIFSCSLILFWIFFSVIYFKAVPNSIEPFNLAVLSLNVNRQSRNTDSNVEKTKLACSIVFLYSILILPLLISVVVELFLPPKFLPDPWVDPRKSYETRSVATEPLEPLFTYSRYIYNAVVPIIVLISDRDIRFAGRSIFCCRRNDIANTDIVESESKLKLAPELVSSDTPVLFPTSDGVFLTVSQKAAASVDQGGTFMSAVDLKLSSTVCDSSALKPFVENEVTRPPELKENQTVRNEADIVNIGLPTKPRSFSPPVESFEPRETFIRCPNSPKGGLTEHANSSRTYSKL